MTAPNPATPIKHVVIIVKENHSFDNYFGTFPNANGDASLAHAPDPIKDPSHDHAAWLRRNRPAPHGAVRMQYTQQDIPEYWQLATQFTLCDNYFTDVASQSDPNHLMLIAANSPLIDNFREKQPGAHGQPVPPFNLPSLPAALATGGMEWRDYADANESYFRHIADLAGSPSNVPAAQFDTDVAAGFLPAVAWLYAPSGYSEHPPWGANPGPVIQKGMQWTIDRVNAIGASPLWASTAIFITWDDWGGWYDHVDPPDEAKLNWQDDGTSYAGTQFRYGPRVPCIVVSPYARAGYISTHFHSHVSVVKFCLGNFNLPPLGALDADPDGLSDDMGDCFDYGQQPLAPPAIGAPRATALVGAHAAPATRATHRSPRPRRR